MFLLSGERLSTVMLGLAKTVLEVYFLDKEQKVQSWLIGKYAIEDENKRIITVQDSVVLFNHNAEKLETDELIWDQGTNMISTKYHKSTITLTVIVNKILIL